MQIYVTLMVRLGNGNKFARKKIKMEISIDGVFSLPQNIKLVGGQTIDVYLS